MNSENSKANPTPRPTRYLNSAEDNEETLENLDNEELSLSPERINDGASTTTFILHKILEGQKSHDFRNWGINE